MKSGLSHKDYATHEYCHGCFLGLGTDEPSPSCGSTMRAESKALRALLGMLLDTRWNMALEIEGRHHVSSQRQMGKSDYLWHQLEY
jgi:hypothetical protein